MKAEPKISDLKYTNITHGLERLAQFGIMAGIWQRIRFDDGFAKEVSEILLSKNQEIPGRMYEGNLARKNTRLELLSLLDAQDVKLHCLSEKEVWELLPRTLGMEQPSLIDETWPFEWYLVDFGYPVDEETARIELGRRNLIPCNTEEGLAFKLTYPADAYKVIILDSWNEVLGEKSFLHLTQMGNGRPAITLDPASEFKKKKFLAKRKPYTEKVLPEEE